MMRRSASGSAALGVERVGGTPEAFGVYLRAKVEETDKVAKAAGLKPE